MKRKNPSKVADGEVLYCPNRDKVKNKTKNNELSFGITMVIISVAYLKENHLIRNWSVQIDRGSGARDRPIVLAHPSHVFLAEANHDGNLRIPPLKVCRFREATKTTSSA